MGDVRTQEDEDVYGMPLLAVYRIKKNNKPDILLEAKQFVNRLMDDPDTLPIVKKFIRLHLQPTDYQLTAMKEEPKGKPKTKKEPKTDFVEPKKEKATHTKEPKAEPVATKKGKATHTKEPKAQVSIKKEHVDWRTLVLTHGKLHVMYKSKEKEIKELLSKYKFVTGRDKPGCIAIKAPVLHRIGRGNKNLEKQVKTSIDSGKVDIDKYWRELFFVYCVTMNEGKGIAPYKKFCHMEDKVEKVKKDDDGEETESDEE